MDLQKAGALIRKLRLEKQMTQRQLAEKMGVAPKTISKWECAQGFPDVSLLPDLSDALGTDMTSLLSGQRNEKEKDEGNMKRIQFYTCPACGNILTATGGAEIACCSYGCIPNRMPRCACRKCRMRRGISDAAKTACTHAG